MLRVNIATRPFYNERGIHLLLAAIGLTLLAIVAFNGTALMRLSGREAELRSRISVQETRSRDLRQEAAKLRGSIRQDELEAVLAAAREANGLIDLRTFSWTALFNELEATLPEDVMLTAVRPSVEKGQVTLTLGVVARRVDAIDHFMTRLEERHAFRNVLSRDEQVREDGAFEATLVGLYTPGDASQAASQASAATVAPDEGPGR